MLSKASICEQVATLRVGYNIMNDEMYVFFFYNAFVFCCCYSLGGESEQYSMYPSNRVKRRPAPYEVELDEGRRILDLYKYGKMHFCCVLLLPV